MMITAMLPILLLTYFEPFDGRDVNRSESVARALAEEPALREAFERIVLCSVPVVYDRAEESTGRCISEARAADDANRPMLVVSFGEYDGTRLRIETAAHNLDNTPGIADNAGVVRSGSRIVEGGPESIGFLFPFTEFFKSGALRALDPRVSSSPGAFLCNHLAYQLARRHVETPFVFIHVGREVGRNLGSMTPEAAPLAEALVRSANAISRPDQVPLSLKELMAQLRSGRVPPDEAWWKSRLADDMLDRVH